MGLFIVVEGIDRSGKSTLVRNLKEKLEGMNVLVKTIGYPNRKNMTGPILDKALKGEIKTCSKFMHLLFSANRWEEMHDNLEYLQKDNAVLLCDRYILSGASYSIANGLGDIFSFSTEKGLPVPDVTIFLDTPPSEVAKRKDFGKEIYENTEFQEKVYETMKQNIRKYDHVTIPTCSPEETLSKAMGVLKVLFKGK